MIDDGVKDASAPDHVGPAPRFHLEDQAAPIDFHELGGGAHRRSDRHGLEMIHFNAHANLNRTGRQGAPGSLGAGIFHEADHRGRGENRRPIRVVVSEREFRSDNALAEALQSRFDCFRIRFAHCSPFIAARSLKIVRPGGRGIFGKPRLAFQKSSHHFGKRRSALRPQAALQAAIILRAGEDVRHESTKRRAAFDKLNHARGHGAAQEIPAIEAPGNARGEFQIGGEGLANPRGIFRGLPGDQLFRQQFA